MTDSSKSMNTRAQEDTLTSSEVILSYDDVISLGETSHNNQWRVATSWTSEQNSNIEPGLLQETSIDELPIAGSANGNFNVGAEISSDRPFKLRPRSARRLIGRQEVNNFCPLPPRQQQQQQWTKKAANQHRHHQNFPRFQI